MRAERIVIGQNKLTRRYTRGNNASRTITTTHHTAKHQLSFHESGADSIVHSSAEHDGSKGIRIKERRASLRNPARSTKTIRSGQMAKPHGEKEEGRTIHISVTLLMSGGVRFSGYYSVFKLAIGGTLKSFRAASVRAVLGFRETRCKAVCSVPEFKVAKVELYKPSA